MIVLPDQRLVFLHIHKNAGSSVRSFLKRLGEETLSKTWKNENFRGHVNYRDMVKAAPELAQFQAFAISRNPWSRLVSAYEWWKSKPDTRQGITQARVAFLGSFSEFVDLLFATLEKSRSDPALATKLHGVEAHSKLRLQPDCALYASQHSYLIDQAGHVVVDVVPIEQLSEALPAYLSEKLGRPVRWRPFERNRNAKGDWRRYYTDDTAEKVGALFAADAALLGYSFDQATVAL
ncbi:MAG: sulfotransferase family 2 domain-containing protein [Pseudomonadota bacterium]